MKITQEPFGKTAEGQEVSCYRLTNRHGAYIEVITYGGTLRSIAVPDQNGALTDVCLGYNTMAEYENNGGFLGALVGRNANRIRDGHFELNGVSYQLAINDGTNHLHGGIKGFNQCMWEAKVVEDALVLHYFSADGEENYPGNLTVQVTYRFTDENELLLDYSAQSDADTVVNLTNHVYFNLSGEKDGTILDHFLRINAAEYTESDPYCLATGVISPVAGTPLDFRTFKEVGKDIADDYVQIKNGNGYDHNFVLGSMGTLRLAATLYSPKTGIEMNTWTNQPGVQLYTGNGLENALGKSGTAYAPRSGLCLETQCFPNAMEYANFPSPILRAGEQYSHKTVYQFGIHNV